MQLIPYELVLLYSIPSILIGMGAGYTLGKQGNMSSRNRVGLSIVGSPIGGLIIALFISTIREGTSIHFLLSVLSFLGGCFFGLVGGWVPSPRRYIHHIIYEDDDEETFDREIDEALRGSYEE